MTCWINKSYDNLISRQIHLQSLLVMGARDTRSETLPDIFVVVGVELRVGSVSDNILVSCFFSVVPSLPGVGFGCPVFPASG